MNQIRLSGERDRWAKLIKGKGIKPEQFNGVSSIDRDAHAMR